MAKLTWVGKKQCATVYNRERLGLSPVRCGRYASPGKDKCKGCRNGRH